MFTKLPQQLTLFASLLTLTLTPMLPLPSFGSTTTRAPQTTQTPGEENPTEATTIYEKAKEELPDNFYILYRIVERIARANDLDDYPWRVVVDDSDEINAHATDVNLIIVYFGLIDQMIGDASALACVVGHEMAHQTQQHIAIRTSKIAEWREEFKDEDSEEMRERIADLSRAHELEADAIGYRYIVTAGFEAEGCLRGLTILARLPETLRDSVSHPAVPTRMEALKKLIAEGERTSFVDRGSLLLNQTEPLTYNLLEENRWLRINSQRGGSYEADLERLFPQ